MDAGAIYRRLPGLTEGEAVALALAYQLGAVDAKEARAADRTAPAWTLLGAGRDAGHGRMHGLVGALGGTLDARTMARLVEWYAAGWDDMDADDYCWQLARGDGRREG